MSNSAISGPIFTDVRRSPSGSAAAPSWSFADSTGTGVYLASTDVLALSTAGVQRVVVDAAGNVGIGTDSPGRKLVVAGTVAGGEVSAQIRNDTTGVGTARLVLSNLSDTNASGFQIINNGDDGIVNLLNYKNTPLAFWTNSAERMRIDASGNITLGPSTFTAQHVVQGSLNIGNTSTSLLASEGIFAGGTTGSDKGYLKVTRDSAQPVAINRLTNDGALIALHQGGTQEGVISVSGTTVTYGGGHLARWSQFEDKSTPPVYRGTVMSSTGVMASWDGEENEQLTCSKISDLAADTTVSGIFQEYDTNDDPESVDFWVAQSGDFIIRVAQGVVVAVGDLLESAGDGTARPQTDNLVRSSTIAKVMSSTPSTTYPDGSYCIPCLLML